MLLKSKGNSLSLYPEVLMLSWMTDRASRYILSIAPITGFYVPCGLWRQMENFSTNALAVVLCSTKYEESDYIRGYDEFLKYREEYAK